MKTKRCSICHKYKLRKYFYKSKYVKDGLQSMCIKCDIKRSKIYRKNHKIEITERVKLWTQKNSLRVKLRVKNYEKRNAIKIAKRKRKYYKLNHKKIQKVHTQYMKKIRKINLTLRLTENLRRRINTLIRQNYKSQETLILLGCSVEFLKLYLASKFTTGMSWKNYGKWHIDHIKPCASFDLRKPNEQKKCFHYTNLQPLWAKDNLRKKDKFSKKG
jgi:hypothetical protein